MRTCEKTSSQTELGMVDDRCQRIAQPRRWRLRFTLQLMLALVTLLGIVLGWWTHRARQQQWLVQRIIRGGGAVEYDFPRDPRTDEPLNSNIPKWLLDSLGVDYFHNVTEVRTEDPSVLPDLPRFRRLDRLVVGTKKWTDEDITPIARLRTLRSLLITLGDNETPLPPIGDPLLKVIAELPRLESAWIAGSRITQSGIESLTHSTSLCRVHVACADPNVDAKVAESFLRAGRVSYLCIERFNPGADVERVIEWESARSSRDPNPNLTN